jgi:predicted SnoaL-like aldol condensation-catalyzing enzyme
MARWGAPLVAGYLQEWTCFLAGLVQRGEFMKIRLIAFASLVFAWSICQAQQADPKKIVTEFSTMAFVDRRPIEAANRYISPETYIQHNPNGKDGRESFINGFAKYVETTAYKCEIKRVIAERDLVVVHSHCKEKPESLGSAVVDIFRVELGFIVEHWDVMQAVPESPKNSNTMF